MNPFATPADTGGAPYPSSAFARSALPQAGGNNGGVPQAVMSEGSRRHVALVVAVFVVAAFLFFHWHFNRG